MDTREIGARSSTYAISAVPHDEHKPNPPPSILVAQLVQRAQRAPVLVETVNEAPAIHDLEPLGEESADLLGDARVEKLLLGLRIRAEAGQRQRAQAWQPNRRGLPSRRGEGPVNAVATGDGGEHARDQARLLLLRSTAAVRGFKAWLSLHKVLLLLVHRRQAPPEAHDSRAEAI